VKFSSAQRLARAHSYMVEDANHMEVCKPPSREHPSYKLLVQFINTCGKVARQCDQPLHEVHELPQSTFGLESYVERLETLVTSEGSDAAPRYVGVWGMGGVGKTLLLQTLYGSPKVHGHFQGAKFIWRTVGQTPDIMAVYRSLSEGLDSKPELYLNLADYKFKLHNQFLQKRVFLVLDDVWEDEVFDSLDLAKGKGSVTLLSTRNQSLLKRASPHIRQEHMTPLSKEDSWSLFCVHAFTPPSNVPDESKEFAQSMAQECEGLPLALKVIGGAMFGKDSCQWEPLLKKLRESRLQETTVEERLYKRLKLGYDLLSEDRLRRCFHYFAAFPEDSNIVFEEVLFHWTGEGLVPKHYGDDPRPEAFSLLKELWERSFIESNGQFCSDQCYLLNFKVHDVMRDLAFYLLEKDCGTPHAKQLYLYRAGQNLEEIPQEWKAISESPESECTTILEALRLSLDTNKFKTLPKFYAPKLVFLLLGRNPIVSLPADFSSYFPKLSVLNLRNGQFHSLPDELGDLKNLVCLDLSNCHELEILPDTVRKFHKLKFLILDDCWSLKYLPSGVVDLTSLQVLHTAHCVCLTWAEHTLSRTARAGFGDLYPTVGASLENICQLLLLTELTIFPQDHPVLEQFSPRKLMLEQFKSPRELPHSISSLTKLKLLQVCLDIETLPDEMAYRCIQLQQLELRSSLLKHIPTSFTHYGAFPSLISLKLSCAKLVEFPEVEKDALPTLRTLDLTGCWSLKSLPLSLKQLTKLSNLIVEYCDDTLKDSCRTNCETSSIWRKFHIQVINTQKEPLHVQNSRKYTFSAHHSNEIAFKRMYMQWEIDYLNRERSRQMRRQMRKMEIERRSSLSTNKWQCHIQ
jgi:Leucine-rich repeat (LRR) protein